MNTGIIASRYAAALLKLVDETGSGDAVVSQAKAIIDALTSFPDLRRLLSDPSVPADKKISLLEVAATGDRSGSPAVSPELKRFFELLIRNGRIGDITLALKSFEDQFCQSRNIVRGRLVLPSKPDDAARVLEDKIRSLIESKTGKTLQLTTEVDESLIGGFVLEVEDKLLDASVSRQLERIRSQFVERNRRIV
ncbi:MAG: ATP synthase F1 subunit delta [Bacteroidales bacterium]|nr:ATP synthase F1 subunit delta [Bacteroidales bacterium]